MKNKLFLLMLVLVIGVLAACGTGENKTTTENKENTNTENTANTDNKEEKKVLVMGTSADFEPFEFVDTAVSDEIIGFDIDLANLIGEKLGYEIKVENMDFNSLIPAIQSGKFDIVIAGMAPDEKREKVVDFSIPYYETKQMVLTKKDSGISSLEDLAGKKIGVQVGSIQEDVAEEIANTVNGVSVESRNLIPEMVQEIMTKRFDAAVIEDIVALNYAAQNDKLTTFPIEVGPTEDKAVVFPEGSELKAEFDKAIEELINEGKIEELKEKWFVIEE